AGAVEALDGEAAVAELAAQKAREQLVQIGAHQRRGVDDAGALVKVERVPRIQAGLHLAVQTFDAKHCQQESDFDLLHRRRLGKAVTVDDLTHVSLLGEKKPSIELPTRNSRKPTTPFSLNQE